MRRRIHPEHHTDLILVNFDPLDECPNDLPTRKPVGFMQSCLDPCGKIIQTTQDEREFTLQARFIFDLLGLLFHLLQAFSHPCHPGFKLPFVDQSFGITINQSGNTLS